MNGKTGCGRSARDAAIAMGVLAATAVSAPNPDSAAGRCGPPGETFRVIAKFPGSTPADVSELLFDGVPGYPVSTFCAPGRP